MKVSPFLFMILLGLGTASHFQATAAERGGWLSTFFNRVQAPSRASFRGSTSQEKGGGAVKADPQLIGTTLPRSSGEHTLAFDLGLINFPIPTVVETEPPDRLEGWPYQWFKLKFDIPLDPWSVNESTVTLHSPGGPIHGKVHLIGNDDTVLFYAESKLDPGTTYTITVHKEIKSKFGMSPNNLRIFSFKSAGEYPNPPEFSMTWVHSECYFHNADPCGNLAEGHCDFGFSDGDLVSIDEKSRYSVKIETNRVEKITDSCNHLDIPVSPGPFEKVINFTWDDGTYGIHYSNFGGFTSGVELPSHAAGSKKQCDVKIYGFDGSPPLARSYSYWCP